MEENFTDALREEISKLSPRDFFITQNVMAFAEGIILAVRNRDIEAIRQMKVLIDQVFSQVEEMLGQMDSSRIQ